MGEKRYIPERTIDSLFAAEVVRSDPTALIWSPSQRATVPYDHSVHTGATTLVVECKAVLSADPYAPNGGPGPWRALINIQQLLDYAGLPFPVVYLMVARPTDLAEPFDPMGCSLSPCNGARACVCCPRDKRSRAQRAPGFSRIPLRLRWQPWFSHWAWLVSASDLLDGLLSGPDHVAVNSAIAATAKTAKDFPVWVHETAFSRAYIKADRRTRLCHLLHRIRSPRTASTASSLDGLVVPSEMAAQGFPELFELTGLDDDPDRTPPMVATMSSGL